LGVGQTHSTNEPGERRWWKLLAELGEERGLTKRNMLQQNPHQTQSWNEVGQTALQRVREVARKDRCTRFTSLMHHLSPSRLKHHFFEIKRNAAPGVDGITWHDYEQSLDENIMALHSRLQSGGYRAKPSRRVFIPKPNSEKRPLGIAALEDKIVQRATVEVLNAIYEVDFKGFSYGFRPKKKAHEALDALAVGIRFKKISYIYDVDIRKYFDSINHDWLMKFLSHRIADKRMLRLIKKWLKAGVLENGNFSKSEIGSPQGASISPLLSNIYLHYVLDLWVQAWRNRKARGNVIIVRWADDFVVGFQYREDALAFQSILSQRFEKFGLNIHPDKSRLIRFGKFAKRDRLRFDKKSKPETFDFLGFTHCCTVNRNGKFQVLRLTIKSRFRRKLSELKSEMKRRMHLPVSLQGKWLRAVLQGHMNYYAIPCNLPLVGMFRTQLIRLWYKTLKRRSQKSRLNWSKMPLTADKYLPKARVLHPWPERRFEVMTRGRSPVR